MKKYSWSDGRRENSGPQDPRLQLSDKWTEVGHEPVSPYWGMYDEGDMTAAMPCTPPGTPVTTEEYNAIQGTRSERFESARRLGAVASYEKALDQTNPEVGRRYEMPNPSFTGTLPNTVAALLGDHAQGYFERCAAEDVSTLAAHIHIYGSGD